MIADIFQNIDEVSGRCQVIMKQYVIKAVAIFVCIVALGGVCCYATYRTQKDRYDEAIKCIDAGDYGHAAVYLHKVSDKIGDQKELYQYVKFRIAEKRKKDVFERYNILKKIPKDYSGKYADDIKDARKKTEEEKKFKEIIPYVGMDQKYINVTAAGEADNVSTEEYVDQESGKTLTQYRYAWYVGNNIPLIVFCRDQKVWEVKKYYEDYYWSSDGMPEFYGPGPSCSTHSSQSVKYPDTSYQGTYSGSSTEKSDVYDVQDFDDPDDFADEWAEEFGDGDYNEGYDDAYEYWESER